MIFVFNSLNFRYFNENLSGKKIIIKEPHSGGIAEEEKPVGRERRKEGLLSTFMILSIQNAMSNIVVF